MSENIIMPKLGMAMKEGKVVRWLLSEGEKVEKGSLVAEVETEKINYQLEAPSSGILVKIITEEGMVASVGEIIGVIAQEGEEIDDSVLTSSPSQAEEEQPAPAPAPPTAASGGVPSDSKKRKITPVARKMAQDKGVDISGLQGTGPGGRITKEDVLAAASKLEKESERPSEATADKIGAVGFGSSIPLTRIREIIGERLSASSRDVPHVYFACEVDGTKMMEFRKTALEIIESATGVRLSVNDILLKAVAVTIEKFPMFNATLEGKLIKIAETVNIGLAAAMEEGLIVPVIRNVNQMTLAQIAVARREILDKAKAKKLNLDDLSGGTFTISNLGQYNIDFFTSIINPPETAILSVAKMKDRVVVIDGQIEIRPIMYVGLSADHRVVDGTEAAAFLQELQNILENPYKMLLL